MAYNNSHYKNAQMRRAVLLRVAFCCVMALYAVSGCSAGSFGKKRERVSRPEHNTRIGTEPTTGEKKGTEVPGIRRMKHTSQFLKEDIAGQCARKRKHAPFRIKGRAKSKLCDISGELRLVSKNNDLYLERADGNRSRRLTYTPDIDEFGYFVENTEYIIYYEKEANGMMSGNYFVISKEGNDRNRKEISWEGFKKLYLAE